MSTLQDRIRISEWEMAILISQEIIMNTNAKQWVAALRSGEFKFSLPKRPNRRVVGFLFYQRTKGN